MSVNILVCNVCKRDNKVFKVANDQFGAALMKAHLLERHQIEIPLVSRYSHD